MFDAAKYSAVANLCNGRRGLIRALKPEDRENFIAAAGHLPAQLLLRRFFGERRHFTGAALSPILADAGYKGHDAPPSHKMRVYTAGQKRGVTKHIKRIMRRRAAVEPVIGHMKNERRMGRDFLAHATGGARNAVLTAAGHNFRRLLSWLRHLRAWIVYALCASKNLQISLRWPYFTDDFLALAPVKNTSYRTVLPTNWHDG